MKRFLIIVLALVLVISLVACQDDSGKTNNVENNTEDTDASTNKVHTTDESKNPEYEDDGEETDDDNDSDEQLTDDSVASKGLEFEVNADKTTCTITGIGTCKDSVLNIPTKIQKYNVTAIKSGAFTDCEFITEVVIPEGIAIDDVIFKGCVNLKKITTYSSFANGLAFFVDYDDNYEFVETVVFCAETLNDYSFYDVPGFKNFIMGDNVKNIGKHVFLGAGKIEYLYISKSVENIDPLAFEYLVVGAMEISLENKFYAIEYSTVVNKQTGEVLYPISHD